MVQIRDLESKKVTRMVEHMPKECMTMLTNYVTEHYAQKGGWDKPQEYTNFMLRLMQRPMLQYDPELFSKVNFMIVLESDCNNRLFSECPQGVDNPG